MQTPLTNITDENILSLLQNNRSQEQGFRLLMSKYQERLYWAIRHLVTNHDDANDVLQDCLVKVFRNIQSFEGKSKLYTWLYRIAINEAITFLNKQGKKTLQSINDEETKIANQLRADEHFDGEEVQIRLQKALSQLPDKQRLVFNMRYYDEMSYEQMSDILDTSVGALKASYHHAVKKIENYFREVEI